MKKKELKSGNAWKSLKVMLTALFLLCPAWIAFSRAHPESEARKQGVEEDSSWGNTWGSIQKTARKVKSVRTRFVQKKRMKMLKDPLVSRGRLVFKSPKEIRWEYISPFRSLVVMRKGRMDRFVWRNGKFVKDADAETRTMHIVLQEVADWMKGEFTSSKSFNASLKPGIPSVIVMKPRIKAIKKFIEQITVTLSRTPGIIQKVEIIEPNDATTTLEFTHSQVDRK